MNCTPQNFLFRWLGVAGIEFRYCDFSILVDPYLSRISTFRMLFGKAHPNEHRIFSRIISADTVLVTHSHFDHLMDVPVIAKKFKCPVYGSANTCELLKRCDVPVSQIRLVAPDDNLSIGPFLVKVMKSSHPSIPFVNTVVLPKTDRPPKHALDFGMDSQFAYKINAGLSTCLTDPGKEGHKEPVDLLFVSTLQGCRVVSQAIKIIDPAVVIPIHWDNYFKPIAGSSKAPGWGLVPVNRVALKALRSLVHTLTPRGRFFVPEPFKFYRLEDVLQTKHEYPQFPTIFSV
jgi:L-ascorbate metabolism protein UlaG (beta-lactamase superfamily)